MSCIGSSDYNSEVEILLPGTPYHCQNQLFYQAGLEETGLGRKNGGMGNRSSEYDIEFVPQSNIKSQMLVDFLVELSASASEESSSRWTPFVDGSFNLKGSGAEIVLEGPGDLILEYSLCFNF